MSLLLGQSETNIVLPSAELILTGVVPNETQSRLAVKSLMSAL